MFPQVNVSIRWLNDKFGVTKGIENIIKKIHRLYKSSIRSSSQENTVKYKICKVALRKYLKSGEESCYHQMFDDTKQSA